MPEDDETAGKDDLKMGKERVLSETQEKLLNELLKELTPLELSILLRIWTESIREYVDMRQKKENVMGREQGRSTILEVIEDVIYKKYGDDGLQVFWKVNGRFGTTEISDRTGVSEEDVMKILGYLRKRGIIEMDFLTRPTKRLDSIAARIDAVYKNKRLFEKFKLFVSPGIKSAACMGQNTSFSTD